MAPHRVAATHRDGGLRVTQPGYIITAVDGGEYRSLLRKLQKRILPSDDLVPPWQGYWWLAHLDYTAVGFGCLEMTAGGLNGFLSRAGVLRGHHGHHLQVRLIRARIAKARRLGLRAVVSDTRVGNVPSAKSLIRCGLRPYEPKETWRTGTDTIYWRLRLPTSA